MKIAEVNINLYYIHEGCSKTLFSNDKYYNLEIALSKKLKLFLKDIIIYNMNGIYPLFVWLDNFNINNEYDMNIIYDLLSFDEDIFIIS